MIQRFLMSLFIITTLFSCKKNDDTSSSSDDTDSVSTIAEQALSESSSHASSSEGGSVSQSMLDNLEMVGDELKQMDMDIKNYIDPKDRVTQKTTACRYSVTGGNRTCSNGTGTIVWADCTIGLARMSGGWTETWPSNTDCVNSYLPSSGVVKRSSTGSTLTLPLGATIVTDTQGGTAYDGTVISSGEVWTTRTSGTRSIAMIPTSSGIHKKGTTRRGATWFDYYVRPSITVSGALKNTSSNGLTGNRVMSGDVTIWHNIARYTATNTFASVTWGDSTCCYPTSGTISATYSGTNKPADSSVMTFTSTCGQASIITTTNGTASTSVSVTLADCQ